MARRELAGTIAADLARRPWEAAVSTTRHIDELLPTTADPPGGQDCTWAWTLERGTDQPLRVRMLDWIAAGPARPPHAYELFLWFAAPRPDAAPTLLALLDDAECAAALQLRYDADRLSFAAARVGLRALLARSLGCEPRDLMIERGAHGKPALTGEAGQAVRFNVSHTRGVVAVAIAAIAVGIDVERRRRAFADRDAVAATAFVPESVAALEAADDGPARDALFYRMWTLGEAFIKTTGESMSQGLDSFAFTPDGTQRLLRVDAPWGPAGRWQFDCGA